MFIIIIKGSTVHIFGTVASSIIIDRAVSMSVDDYMINTMIKENEIF